MGVCTCGASALDRLAAKHIDAEHAMGECYGSGSAIEYRFDLPDYDGIKARDPLEAVQGQYRLY